MSAGRGNGLTIRGREYQNPPRFEHSADLRDTQIVSGNMFDNLDHEDGVENFIFERQVLARTVDGHQLAPSSTVGINLKAEIRVRPRRKINRED